MKLVEKRRMGIDLGGRRIAWSVFQGHRLDYVSDFELKATGNRAQELHECSSQLAVELVDVDEVFIEEPYIGRGIRASLQLAQMGGAVLAVIGATTTLNPVLVPVSTWKKAVCGHGGLDKDGVTAWLEAHHSDWLDKCRYVSPRGLDKVNQDLVDVICIGYYGVALARLAHGLGSASVRGTRDRSRRHLRVVP